MDSNLFEKIDYDNDALWVVKDALNTFNASYFPEFIESLILKKEGGGDEYGGCRFPSDLDESEIYHDYGGNPFEGVECWYLEDNVVVSEDEFFKLLKEACERYIELHPDKTDEIEQIMSQSTLI